jgi:hypothetical protein
MVHAIVAQHHCSNGLRCLEECLQQRQQACVAVSGDDSLLENSLAGRKRVAHLLQLLLPRVWHSPEGTLYRSTTPSPPAAAAALVAA